jgi:hypothetical protein
MNGLRIVVLSCPSNQLSVRSATTGLNHQNMSQEIKCVSWANSGAQLTGHIVSVGFSATGQRAACEP